MNGMSVCASNFRIFPGKEPPPRGTNPQRPLIARARQIAKSSSGTWDSMRVRIVGFCYTRYPYNGITWGKSIRKLPFGEGSDKRRSVFTWQYSHLREEHRADVGTFYINKIHDSVFATKFPSRLVSSLCSGRRGLFRVCCTQPRTRTSG